MKPKIRTILEECIDTGIEHGLNMAHKHTDSPTELNIKSCIEIAIWYEIDQRFEFDRDLVSEVVEGFDHLKAQYAKKSDSGANINRQHAT
jgi:hypothetical protein